MGRAGKPSRDPVDHELVPATPPSDLRASTVELGGTDFLVLSYPATQPDLYADTRLTPSEADVAEQAIAGRSNAEIARARGTSQRTVANQMAAVLHKLGVGSRQELAVQFVRGKLSVGKGE